MQLHHQKHHQAYVNNLNLAEEKLYEAKNKNDLPASIALQSMLKFNGGGHINHSIFWTNLAPIAKGGGEPPKGRISLILHLFHHCCITCTQYNNVGNLLNAIQKDFANMDNFIKKFNTSAAAVQGSGWCWLVGYVLS